MGTLKFARFRIKRGFFPKTHLLLSFTIYTKLRLERLKQLQLFTITVTINFQLKYTKINFFLQSLRSFRANTNFLTTYLSI